MQESDNRIGRIDHLRAIAILLVFSDHFFVAMFGFFGYEWQCSWFHWNDSPSFFSALCRCTLFQGELGVSLFFIISGLCIRVAQKNARDYSIGHFYWRRFWRIYPPYLIALLSFAAISHYKDFKDIFVHLVLAHNFSTTYFWSINRPFWSLALEVQVYLLYPVLCLMYSRWGTIKTGAVLFLLAVGSYSVGGESVIERLHCPSLILARQLPTRLWFTWYLGFLVAEAMTAGLRPTRLSRVVLITALIIYPLVRFYRPLMPFEISVSSVILTLLVWEYLTAQFNTGYLGKCMAYLGLCSYSFYLYFDQLLVPILNTVTAWAHLTTTAMRFTVGFPATLLLIFAFSYISYRIIELGSVSLGRKLFPRPRGESTTIKIAPDPTS